MYLQLTFHPFSCDPGLHSCGKYYPQKGKKGGGRGNEEVTDGRVRMSTRMSSSPSVRVNVDGLRVAPRREKRTQLTKGSEESKQGGLLKGQEYRLTSELLPPLPYSLAGNQKDLALSKSILVRRKEVFEKNLCKDRPLKKCQFIALIKGSIPYTKSLGWISVHQGLQQTPAISSGIREWVQCFDNLWDLGLLR